MDRLVLGATLLAAACRSPEPARSPEDIEARASEIKARLLAKCQAGDEGACHRLRAADSAGHADDSSTPEAPAEIAVNTLELDSWPAGMTGLFLGTTPAETSTDCGRMGGSSLMLRSDQTQVAHPDDIDDGGTIICVERRKVDPSHRRGILDDFLLLTTGMAIVSFCLFDTELRACELQLDLSDDSLHFASELRRKIENQYGAMTPSEPDFNCRSATDRNFAFRGTWSWETTAIENNGAPFPVGSLLLNYGCTPVVERPKIFLVLRDTVGMLRATGQVDPHELLRPSKTRKEPAS